MGTDSKMKTFAVIALMAAVVAATSIPHETANLEEATDLLQERVLAKVGVSAKAKIGAQVKARATVMIGEHTVDAAAVSMAKAQMHKVLHKLGQKHPHFISESAGVETLLDALELELIAERDGAIQGRRKKEAECKATISANDKAISQMQSQNANLHATRKNHFDKIQETIDKITDSKTKEGGSQKTSLQSMMKSEVDGLKKTYDDYWLNSDDRALVRNILMQAMWLVCTGFRSFRMHPFCVTLRQQPDYAEPKTAGGVVNPQNPSNEYKQNVAASKRFAATMAPVWKQQKAADADAVNKGDGDVDMEKGFVNNRAPWGVAPDGTPAVAPTKEMTNDELSQRLQFLLETSNAPSRVATPIVDFVKFLQQKSGTMTGKSKSLVDTIVAMDTEEG